VQGGEDCRRQKVILIALCIAISLGLVACKESDETLDTKLGFDTDELAVEYDYYDIVSSGKTLSGFSDKLKSQQKSGGLSSDFFEVIKEENLSFSSYDFDYGEYVKYKNEDGNYTGAESTDLYWKEKGGEYSSDSVFRVHIFRFPQGVTVADCAPGYEQYNEAGTYIKQANNNKTAYVVLINNLYFCRFVIRNDCADYDTIVSQLMSFCLSLNNYV
jgi:hypothetical protein